MNPEHVAGESDVPTSAEDDPPVLGWSCWTCGAVFAALADAEHCCEPVPDVVVVAS